MSKLRSLFLLAGAMLAPCLSGCNPFAMGIFTPVPVQPWMAAKLESRLQNSNENFTNILAPIPPGYTPLCEDPPDRDTINRHMPEVIRGVPYVVEEFREIDDYSVAKLVDTIDPPRFFPWLARHKPAPLPLEVHRVLHGNTAIRLAGPVPDQETPSASYLYRPRSLAPVCVHA